MIIIFIKKRLVTLGVAGLLAGGSNAYDRIDSNKDKISINLVDALSTEKILG